MFVSVKLDDGCHISTTAFIEDSNTSKNDGCEKYESGHIHAPWDERTSGPSQFEILCYTPDNCHCGIIGTRCSVEITFEGGCCAGHTAPGMCEWDLNYASNQRG